MRKQTKIWLLKSRAGFTIEQFAKYINEPVWKTKKYYSGVEGIDVSVNAHEKIDDEFRLQLQSKPLTWKERILMLQVEVGKEFILQFVRSHSTIYNISRGLSIKSNEAGLRKLVGFSKGLLTDEIVNEQIKY